MISFVFPAMCTLLITSYPINTQVFATKYRIDSVLRLGVLMFLYKSLLFLPLLVDQGQDEQERHNF